LTTANYKILPDIIPIHYNVAGEADGFGSKTTILTLLVIASIIFVGLTIVNRFPHILNYPTVITNENAQRQYTIATRLIRHLKLATVLIFGYLVFATNQCAKGQVDRLGAWFLPIAFGSFFVHLKFTICFAKIRLFNIPSNTSSPATHL